MAWITESEKARIIESATRAGVSKKDVTRIKGYLKASGVSITQTPQGQYIGIETARGTKLVWGEYVGMTRTV